MAQNNMKFLEELPGKFGSHWQGRFFFVELPGEYPMRRYWGGLKKGVASEPDMTDEMAGFLQMIREVLSEKRSFIYLTSAEVLRQARKNLLFGKDIYIMLPF